MNLTKLSIERPTLLAVILIILIFFGVFSYSRLSYELVPRFTPPVLTIATVYRGSPAEVVEKDVTVPIEDALSSLENIDVITSVSKENFSLVRLEMKTGTDIDLALQDASRKLQVIQDKLPEGSGKPVLSRFDFNDLPVMRIALFADLTSAALTTFAEDEILPQLKKLPGIAEARLTGGRHEEITVKLNPRKMADNRVSALQVPKALGNTNRNIPAGYLESDSNKTSLKYTGAFTSIEDIGNLVIYENPQYNIKVRVKDIATVERNLTKPLVITRLNGKPSLGIDIKKQTDANAVDLSAAVNKQLKSLETTYSKQALKFEVAADTSTFTVTAANAVMEDLLLAVLLVSLVMLIFLHSIRSAIIVMVAIPVSVITTFIVMYLLGYSLNLLSLLGLSLSIGILVDDSIVVIENIHRHLSMGKHPIRAAYDGRMEIGFTAISITLIDVVVFVPIILASGMVADLLRQFSVVIVCSTLMSLFVSFTLVPLLAAKWNTKNDNERNTILSRLGKGIDHVMEGIANVLVRAVNWSLHHKLIVLFVATILFAASIYLIPAGYIGIEFTRAGDRSEFILELELDKSSTLDKTDQVSSRAENIILKHPEVVTVFSNSGTTSSGRIESNMSYLAEIYVKLNDKKDRSFSTADFAKIIKEELMKELPGVRVRPIEINIIGLRDDDAVQVSLRNTNRDSLTEPSLQAFRLLEETDGAIEQQTSLDDPLTGNEFVPSPEKMDSLGIDPLQAGITLRTLVNGNQDFSFSENGIEYPINIIAEEAFRSSITEFDSLALINNKGMSIPFHEFGTVTELKTVATLERTNRSPSVTLKSQVRGKPAGSVSRLFSDKLKEAKISEKVDLLWGGSSKRTTEALTVLGIAFAISIFLVYLVLVALYDSWFYPFAVLFSIPLALIGALSAMALAGQALSIFSVMGLIMMTGLVGKNGILIVDFSNMLRDQGKELSEAITTAVRLRFRPVIMTTLTIVIGLMPVALASGAGSEWKNGLAWALIGGLSSSLVLTLIVIPVVYFIIEKLLLRIGRGKLSRKKIKVDEYN